MLNLGVSATGSRPNALESNGSIAKKLPKHCAHVAGSPYAKGVAGWSTGPRLNVLEPNGGVAER